MATLDVSAWALTQFGGTVLNTYTSVNQVKDEMVAYNYQPGASSIVDYHTDANSVSQGEPGTALFSPASKVETAVTTTVDNPLYINRAITWTAISTNGNAVPDYIARQMGQDLADMRSDMLLSALSQIAITAGNVSIYDDEGTDGSAIYGALLDGGGVTAPSANAGIGAISGLTLLQVPEDRVAFIYTPEFYKLRRYAPSASRDYQAQNRNADNASIGYDGFYLGRTLCLPSNRPWKVDMTTDSKYTNIASKYKFNFATATAASGYLAVVFQREALRVHEIEKPNAMLTNQPLASSWFAQVRCQFGTATLRSTNAWVLKGD